VPAPVAQAREELRGRGGAAFTDARAVVVSSDWFSFDHPARLGDPHHLALADTSAVHRDPADGSLRVDSALLTPVPGVGRAAADGQVTWQVDVGRCSLSSPRQVISIRVAAVHAACRDCQPCPNATHHKLIMLQAGAGRG
jgi:hypothetical protein